MVRLVNPSKTSQTCICGYPVPKDLSVRTHKCPECGLVLDRDHVSTILIKNKPPVVKRVEKKVRKEKKKKTYKIDLGQTNIDDCYNQLIN